MYGYKVFLKGLIDSFGIKHEIGKIYKVDGEVKWSKNGFHFCKRPEDTLRNFDDFNKELEIALIEASGKIKEYDDEYYGYYDMYVAEQYKILRVIPKEEIVASIIESGNQLRQLRIAQRMKLTDEQAKQLMGITNEIDCAIRYHQYNEKDIYEKTYKKRLI